MSEGKSPRWGMADLDRELLRLGKTRPGEPDLEGITERVMARISRHDYPAARAGMTSAPDLAPVPGEPGSDADAQGETGARDSGMFDLKGASALRDPSPVVAEQKPERSPQAPAALKGTEESTAARKPLPLAPVRKDGKKAQAPRSTPRLEDVLSADTPATPIRAKGRTPSLEIPYDREGRGAADSVPSAVEASHVRRPEEGVPRSITPPRTSRLEPHPPSTLRSMATGGVLVLAGIAAGVTIMVNIQKATQAEATRTHGPARSSEGGTGPASTGQAIAAAGGPSIGPDTNRAGHDPTASAAGASSAPVGPIAATQPSAPASTHGVALTVPAIVGPTPLGAVSAAPVGTQTPTAAGTTAPIATGDVTPPGTYPPKPAQGAVAAAVRPHLAAARVCLEAEDPIVTAHIVFRPDGSVQSVQLAGGAAVARSGGCIRAALQRVRVPAFSDPSFTYTVVVRPS